MKPKLSMLYFTCLFMKFYEAIAFQYLLTLVALGKNAKKYYFEFCLYKTKAQNIN